MMYLMSVGSMMQRDFSFGPEQFNRLFPFFIRIDAEMRIVAVGSGIKKLYAVSEGQYFNEVFRIQRPSLGLDNDLASLTNQLVVLSLPTDEPLVLRGQFEMLEADRNALFIGTPWFQSVEQMLERDLTIADFAIHDPMVDLLHVLKTHEIGTHDIKVLLAKVNDQRNSLKREREELVRKENMLAAIAIATDELLSNTDFYEATKKSLTVIGKAVGVDRIYLFENGVDAAGIETTSQRFEWNSGASLPQIDNPDLQNVPLEVFGEFLPMLLNKEPFNQFVNRLPESSDLRSALEAHDIKSVLIVPVFLKGRFWGFVGFDDCVVERVWTDAELALLKSFAISIGTALERSLSSKEIYDMALFALENPDPVIRINLRGEVLLRNRAADDIQYFVVDGRRMTDIEFFRYLISCDSGVVVDNPQTVPTFEAFNDEKSYLVVPHFSRTTGHVNIYANNVTDKKKAEELLRQSKQRISSLIQNLQSGVLLEDENRMIMVTNKLFCSMFNIPATPDALIGADCSNTAEQSKHLFRNPEQFVSRIDEILTERKEVLGEIVELADGKFFERDYVPIFVNGLYKGHLWKYTDVTERKNYEKNLKKQEEKYRSIIANMKLGLVEVDKDDHILYANQSFSDISGFEIPELMGRKAGEVFLQGDIGIIEAKNSLRSKGVSDSYEVRVRNKKGEERWWLISGAPNYSDAGEIIGSIGIHLDITEHKKLEDELRIARDKAEVSSRAKESFLANMSHEIRTPLNAVIGMVRELAKTTLSKEQSTYVGHAKSASQHLLSVVNNILDISKIEAGEFRLEHRSFSLRSVFDEVYAIMSVAAKEKLLDLRFAVARDIAPALVGDAGRVRQILLNFISNAIKFTEAGSVTVSCDVTIDIPNTQTVCISVADTGVGMDEAYLGSIFKKFSQEDASISRKFGGTGLGMAITHELIQMMNGVVEVSSVKGKGTEFRVLITFPIGRVDELEDDGVITAIGHLENKKLLLVEDNELNRVVAINSLKSYGINVVEAVNGQDAIDKLKESSFDIVLMDLQMPVMDGLTATRFIRKDMGLQLPIIALTANAFKREVDNCIAAGMNDYVTKPFDEKHFLNVVFRHLNVKTTFRDAFDVPVDEMPHSKKYDLSELQKLARGNNDFILKMIDLFCAQVPDTIEKLQVAYTSRDCQALKAVAHKIKPSVDTLRIDDVKSHVRYLESIPLEGADFVKVGTSVDLVSETLRSVMTDMLKEKETI
jgi:PAS domain S-box-containing protein